MSSKVVTPSTMGVYSIKDLEHFSGIKAHTIRIWEQRHDLFSPQRTDTNIRFYSDDDLRLILNISLLKNHGHKISSIVQMSSQLMHEEVVRLGHAVHTNEDQINALTIAMLDLDEDFFKLTLSSNRAEIGFEKTMTEIIYPFLNKIGILWIANSINPAQEHFITNLIRHEIIIETEKLPSPSIDQSFMLFLPEEELHEIGLLFANYIIRNRGFKTFYLGQSLPTKSLEEVYHSINPDYLFTVCTSKPNPKKIQEYVNLLGSKFKATNIYATGGLVLNNQLSIPENIKLLKSFQSLEVILESLNSTIISE